MQPQLVPQTENVHSFRLLIHQVILTYTQYQSKNSIKTICEASSKRMHAALLQASGQMVEELQKASVHEREYSAGAGNFASSDLLVNKVGVSESYQSPPYIDRNDIGWTYTFACKCLVCAMQAELTNIYQVNTN
jgi:hypothetical protein